MATPYTVEVKNIAGTTSDTEIRDFFAFCGKVTDINVTTAPETKSATVTFEKETAMKTAVLLNNTQLGPNMISVTAQGEHPATEEHGAAAGEHDSDEITQEQKPRARIFAEYLAHGYVIGDAALQRAIELDSSHGVSHRFLNTLQNLDKKYHATDRAKATDESYGLTAKGKSVLHGLGSYFEKATNTATGQRIVKFYEGSARQVQDIHTEAMRLAELKKEAAGGSAYKASGLEKVFGKEPEKKAEEKEGEGAGASTEPSAAPTAAPMLDPESAPAAPKS